MLSIQKVVFFINNIDIQSIQLQSYSDFRLKPAEALTFFIEKKVSKNSRRRKKSFCLLSITKCGWVIFEQVLSFPVLLSYCCDPKTFFPDAEGSFE